MAIHHIGDNTDAVYQNGVLSGVDNDEGTIRAAGTMEAGRQFTSDSITLGSSRFVTISSGVNGVESAYTAGTFNAGDQVIRRVTSDIAGVSNTVLRDGSSNTSNRPYSIKLKRVYSNFEYKSAVRTGGWNEFSGTFDPAVTVTGLGGYDIARTGDESSDMAANSTDNAAHPTAAVPGELTYRDGSPTPNNDNYAARNLF